MKKPFWARWLARRIDSALCLLTSFITGVRPKAAQQLDFPSRQTVYYANHNSHGDFVLVWVSLPKQWRMNTRPVAGADYCWAGASAVLLSKTCLTACWWIAAATRIRSR